MGCGAVLVVVVAAGVGPGLVLRVGVGQQRGPLVQVLIINLMKGRIILLLLPWSIGIMNLKLYRGTVCSLAEKKNYFSFEAFSPESWQ